MCLGIAHSEVRNETEFGEKMFLNAIHVLFFVLDEFGMSFQRFFLSLNGSDEFSSVFSSTSERNSELFLSSGEWLRTEFRAFSVPRNRRNADGMNQNFRSVF